MKSVKNILYVHGLGGSKESQICAAIREILSECEVFAEDFDLYDVAGTREKIAALIEKHEIGLVIGSSFGAFYALARKATPFRIVINPCMSPSREIPMLDPQMPPEVAEELFALEAETYGSLFYNQGQHSPGMAWTTFGIFGTDDELFSYSDFFASLYSPHSWHGRNMAFVQGGKHKLKGEELSEPLRRAFAFVQNNALEHLQGETDGGQGGRKCPHRPASC